MNIYEFIEKLPFEIKNIIIDFTDYEKPDFTDIEYENTNDNLLQLFKLNHNIMLINKSHYEYNYFFYINRKLNTFKKHLDYIQFILRKKSYYLFKNYISIIDYDFLKKNKKIRYKSKTYTNLYDYIKQSINKYDSTKCLDLLLLLN